MSSFFNGLKTYEKKAQFKNKKTYLFFHQYLGIKYRHKKNLDYWSNHTQEFNKKLN